MVDLLHMRQDIHADHVKMSTCFLNYVRKSVPKLKRADEKAQCM